MLAPDSAGGSGPTWAAAPADQKGPASSGTPRGTITSGHAPRWDSPRATLPLATACTGP